MRLLFLTLLSVSLVSSTNIFGSEETAPPSSISDSSDSSSSGSSSGNDSGSSSGSDSGSNSGSK